MERARLKQTTSTNLHSEKMITIEIEKKEEIVRKMIELFFGQQRKMTLIKFMLKNYDLLAELHPKIKSNRTLLKDIDDFHGFPHDGRPHESSQCIECLIQQILCKTCEYFRNNLTHLIISEPHKLIIHQIVPQTTEPTKTENIPSNREIIRTFIGFAFWIVDFLDELDATQDDRWSVKILIYKAAKYFANNIDIWLLLIEQDLDENKPVLAIYTLKEAINKNPDSVKLRMKLTEIEYEYGNHDKSYKVIERALIEFADRNVKIEPTEWIRAALKTGNKNFVKLTIFTTIGMCNKFEGLWQSEYHQELFFSSLVEIFPKNQHIWCRLLFDMEFDKKDLMPLFKIAIEKLPNDLTVLSLIQAKIQWKSFEFPTAQRLFNKVNEDCQWKKLILGPYKQFQDDLEIFREKQKNDIQRLIEADLSSEEMVELARESFSYMPLVRRVRCLEDLWLHGEHELVQKALTKAVIMYSNCIDFWLMKGQIEIKLGKLDQAAETFKSAIESVQLDKELYLHIKLAELNEQSGDLIEAKRILEYGRSELKECSDYVQLWIDSIRLEIRSKDTMKAHSLLYEAMSSIPHSGELWAESITMADESNKKEKIKEAFEKFQIHENEAKYVMLSAAKYLIREFQVDESRELLRKTIELYPTYLDARIYLYKLEKIWGSKMYAAKVLLECIEDSSQLECWKTEWGNLRCHIDNWNSTIEELLTVIVESDNMNAFFNYNEIRPVDNPYQD